MKIQQQIENQFRIIHKIFNNRKGTFDWEDLKQAIEALIKMKMDIALHVPVLKINYDDSEE